MYRVQLYWSGSPDYAVEYYDDLSDALMRAMDYEYFGFVVEVCDSKGREIGPWWHLESGD